MGFSLLFSEGRTLSKVGLNIFLEDHNHGQSFNLSPGVVREPVCRHNFWLLLSSDDDHFFFPVVVVLVLLMSSLLHGRFQHKTNYCDALSEWKKLVRGLESLVHPGNSSSPQKSEWISLIWSSEGCDIITTASMAATTTL
ncbi:hypothetical protein Fcan01_13475 [Folsomia candida]|uniref:Uncharacterized protein n=1 Tax=Folsomia candida TaxID=158441 RepID=A0A226E1L7_FOLCA|nr:hypothetical protein Fcan01_13475 [Folsomia candida]